MPNASPYVRRSTVCILGRFRLDPFWRVFVHLRSEHCSKLTNTFVETVEDKLGSICPLIYLICWPWWMLLLTGSMVTQMFLLVVWFLNYWHLEIIRLTVWECVSRVYLSKPAAIEPKTSAELHGNEVTGHKFVWNIHFRNEDWRTIPKLTEF